MSNLRGLFYGFWRKVVLTRCSFAALRAARDRRPAFIAAARFVYRPPMLIETRPAPFLGVEASILGRPWRDRLDLKSRALAEAIVQQHGLSDMLARVLAGRGVRVEDAARHLEPRLRDLMPDPSVLADMDRAAERLADAVQAGRLSRSSAITTWTEPARPRCSRSFCAPAASPTSSTFPTGSSRATGRTSRRSGPCGRRAPGCS